MIVVYSGKSAEKACELRKEQPLRLYVGFGIGSTVVVRVCAAIILTNYAYISCIYVLDLYCVIYVQYLYEFWRHAAK